MFSVNKFGRSYKQGDSLSLDLRAQIVELSGNTSMREIARRFRIDPSTVSRILKRYEQHGTVAPDSRDHTRTLKKLTFQDSILLETMVLNKGSTSLKELQADLNRFGNCGVLSQSTISKHVRNELPSGKHYSRKRLGKIPQDRFSHANLVYTQLYLDNLSNKDPSTIKFFDECGFQLPDSGQRNYGYSPVGEDCIAVRRYLSTANHTLNFLAGVDGIKYGNILQGPSNSIEFLRFFAEATQHVDLLTQRPLLEVGDTVVVDNFAAHHGQAETALRSYFNDLGMELLFLPVYSPDLNPVEEVFSKLKYLLKYNYQHVVFENLEYAILCALEDITAADLAGYYRHAGYL